MTVKLENSFCPICHGNYNFAEDVLNHFAWCPSHPDVIAAQVHGLEIGLPTGEQQFVDNPEEILELTADMEEPRVKAKPVWGCKIGILGDADLPSGGDGPMRRLVETGFQLITGKNPDFIFSGWSAELTDYEQYIVDSDPHISPLRPADDGLGTVEANFALYVDGWTLGSTDKIGEILCTASDGRTLTIPSKQLTAFLERRISE